MIGQEDEGQEDEGQRMKGIGRRAEVEGQRTKGNRKTCQPKQRGYGVRYPCGVICSTGDMVFVE